MSSSGAVYLFPGQGGYSKGLLGRLIQRHPATGQLLADIDDVARAELGVDVDQLRRDTERDVPQLLGQAPELLQFAIYGASVITASALRDAGAVASLHIGHSFGEIAALTAAGACSVRDGARVVARRIRALAESAPGGGFMAAVPAARAQIEGLTALLASDRLAIAGQNHDRQVVLTGETGAMDLACAVLTAAGIRPVRLSSPYPFHSPALRPAVARLAESLRDIEWRAPSVPVYSPILGRRYEPGDDFASLLASHLVLPFAFDDAIRDAYAADHDLFVECGGRQALADITARVLRDHSGWHVVATDASADRGAGVERIALLTAGAGPDLLRELGTVVGADEADFARFWAAEGHAVLRGLRARYADFSAVPTTFTARADGSGEAAATASDPALSVSTVDVAAPVTQVGVDRSQVRERLAALYGEALEYPPEVFTEDVALEADLGVDSVKQTDLLARAAREFGLPPTPQGFSVVDYPTFGRVVDLMTGSREPRADADSRATDAAADSRPADATVDPRSAGITADSRPADAVVDPRHGGQRSVDANRRPADATGVRAYATV